MGGAYHWAETWLAQSASPGWSVALVIVIKTKTTVTKLRLPELLYK